MSRSLTIIAGVCVLIAFVGASPARAGYTVVHTFIDRRQSAEPLAPLIMDRAGNFFGTAASGGNAGCVRYGSTGCGTVFELEHDSASLTGWAEKVLFRFPGGNGPWFPMAKLTMDGAGDLFGVSADSQFGAPYDCFTKYCGTAFELSRPAQPGGQWTETTLYRFANGADGGNPASGLTPDGRGNFYGTTQTGGPRNFGTVFELSPPADMGGRWTETVISGFENGGNAPEGNVVFDPAGDLYGTTALGGSPACEGGCGVVFKLSPPPMAGGPWTETVIYEFGTNTCTPKSDLAFDSSGNLYGTTQGCPAFSATVFELHRPAQKGGTWTESILAMLNTPDAGPAGQLIFDRAGDIYGATANGGTYGHGTIFRLDYPNRSLHVLHSFAGGSGYVPGAGPIFGVDGGLYGTTVWGGDHEGVCHVAGCGVVYRIGP